MQWKKMAVLVYDRLPFVYLVYASMAVLIFSNLSPAFQIPDEPNHFLRAEQISRGEWVSTFYFFQPGSEHRRSADGIIIYPDSGANKGNAGITELDSLYGKIKFYYERKISPQQRRESGMIQWAKEPTLIPFPNTAFYPPPGYLFSAIAIWVGKAFHFSVLNSLILARILNGLGCVLICFFAIGQAKNSRLLMFLILLLPLTLSLFASVSQDALIISLAACMIGIIDGVESENNHYSNSQLIMLILCISIMGAARPPYFLLILIVPFLHMDWKRKLAAIGISILLVSVWAILNISNYTVAFAPADMLINPSLQLNHILSHPFHFLGLFFNFNGTLIVQKGNEFVGILGWLDLYLPDFYYKIAWLLLIVISIVSYRYPGARPRLRFVFLFISVITFLAIMTTQYITWMPLDSPRLGGFQSRYFTPVSFFLVIGIVGFQKTPHLNTVQRFLLAVVVLFPLLSLWVSVQGYLHRYYLH